MDELPLEVHPDGRNDALQAYDWYAARSPRTAEAFRLELEDAMRAIQSAPDRWAKYKFDTRRFIMKRFPFVVVYRVSEVRIEILAVAHGSREPNYWTNRTADSRPRMTNSVWLGIKERRLTNRRSRAAANTTPPRVRE